MFKWIQPLYQIPGNKRWYFRQKEDNFTCRIKEKIGLVSLKLTNAYIALTKPAVFWGNTTTAPCVYPHPLRCCGQRIRTRCHHQVGRWNICFHVKWRLETQLRSFANYGINPNIRRPPPIFPIKNKEEVNFLENGMCYLVLKIVSNEIKAVLLRNAN
jgi:hypothetical protein